jgi:hypothetical protein
MLTATNYTEQVLLIDYISLPENIQKGYDFVKKATSNYSNWDVYYKSDSIKKVMDLYFSKVEIYVPKLSPPQSKSTNQKKETKPKAERKETHYAPETPANLVERLDEEIKVIKRFVNLDGHVKTQEEIVRFINSLQKSIVERKIRKASAYASHIEYIQEALIKIYNSMGTKTTIKIDEKKVVEYEAIIGGEKIYPSIQYIKKYLNLVGKTGIKQKATELAKLMESAVTKKKVLPTDKYADKMNIAFKKLIHFIENPTEKTIELESQELNGLQGIVDGCTCSSLHGIESTMPIVMNSMEFANLEFNTIGLQGKWRNLIGDPSLNFTAMVFGKPKMGKSYLCIDFAGYLARYHGKVLYVAKEEGLDFTLQKKLNDKEVKHPNLFVASSLPNDLSLYDFIFLDSVNKLNLQPEDLTALKKRYPQKSFIYVFQTTKDGHFRGANSFQHDVDIVIEIPEKGKATQFGRFNQGGEMNIF